MMWTKLTNRYGLIGYLLIWLIYCAIGCLAYEIAGSMLHQRQSWPDLLVVSLIWGTVNIIFIWLTIKSRSV